MAWDTNLGVPLFTTSSRRAHMSPIDTYVCTLHIPSHLYTQVLNLMDAHSHMQTDMDPRPEDLVVALPGSLHPGQDWAGRGWEVRRSWLAGWLGSWFFA